MAHSRSFARRLLEVGAIYALLHTFLFVGLFSYLMVAGVLSREKIRAIARIFQKGPEAAGAGEATPPASETAGAVTPTATGEAGVEAPAPGEEAPFSFTSSASRAKEMLAEQATLFRQRQRFMDEMEQRMGLMQSLMIQLSTKQEALRREREAQQKQEERVVEEKSDAAFQKELEIFNSLSPKVALDQLLLKEAAQAARILFHMDDFAASQVLGAAKSVEQKAKVQEILRMIKDVAPAENQLSSAEKGGGG